MDESLVGHQREDSSQNVALVPWLPPAPFPLPSLQDPPHGPQPVQRSHLWVVETKWVEVASAKVLETHVLRVVAAWDVVQFSHWTVAVPTVASSESVLALAPFPLSAV